MKKVLITGGAGFIGSMVNKILYDQGYATVVYDNLSTGDIRNVVRGVFVQGDLADRQRLHHVFEVHEIDAVMHFAASIDVGESVRDPGKYYTNNVQNTLHLLDTMREYSVDTLIFSSTAVLYAGSDEKKIAENHPVHPLNPYGESKLMCERIIRDYGNAYDLRWTALRYFNAAGGDPDGEIVHDTSRSHNLIPKILNCLLKEEEFTLFGTDYPTPDGTCVRDYIHLYDLATAHIGAMHYLLEGGDSTTFNLGNGRGYSVREVIEAVEHVTQQKLSLSEGPRRLGDPATLIADPSKAESQLNWKRRYPSLQTIIAHAWTTMRAQCDVKPLTYI